MSRWEKFARVLIVVFIGALLWIMYQAGRLDGRNDCSAMLTDRMNAYNRGVEDGKKWAGYQFSRTDSTLWKRVER